MTPIIFDLDGTLLNSAPDIQATVNRLMGEIGQEPLDLATVISFIGNGIGVLCARVAEHHGLPAADVPDLTARLLAHYNAEPATLTHAYPGVFEALSELRTRGHPMAVCTNKPEAPARKVLATFGLDTLFETVVGGDTCATRKPDAGPLRETMARLGHTDCIYVGDSEVDAETAKAAGVPFVFFTHGYCHVPPATLTIHATLTDWADLPGIVAELTA